MNSLTIFLLIWCLEPTSNAASEDCLQAPILCCILRRKHWFCFLKKQTKENEGKGKTAHTVKCNNHSHDIFVLCTYCTYWTNIWIADQHTNAIEGLFLVRWLLLALWNVTAKFIFNMVWNPFCNVGCMALGIYTKPTNYIVFVRGI